MRLYIVRHAEPDYSIDSLTPAGHLEAKALSDWMARLRPDRLYSSPLGRAQATARYTAERLNLPVTIEPWTAELNWHVDLGGSYGRSSAWDTHGHLVRALPCPGRDDWHETSPFDNPAFREGFAKLQGHSDVFLAKLGYQRQGPWYEVTRPNADKIVVFCHGGFGLTWLAHLLDLPLPLVWASFFLSPSSVTTILMDEREPGRATPRCLHLAEIAHLHAAGLPASTSGIKANHD
ncbi:MAG: histidine phosphatase family protein [Phycisphaeraceae bacterium]|nr:histidine phosphatase family protein [Phycisphaeraceae bacterium]